MKELYDLIHRHEELKDQYALRGRILETALRDLQSAKVALEQRTPPKISIVSELLNRTITALGEDTK